MRIVPAALVAAFLLAAPADAARTADHGPDDASRRSPLAAAVHGVIDRLRALAGKRKVTRTGLHRNTKRTSRR